MFCERLIFSGIYTTLTVMQMKQIDELSCNMQLIKPKIGDFFYLVV